jgi:SAM-dependent methyltransferase
VDTPAAWLVDHLGLLPQDGRALDIASGRGRNALWLADQGLTVTAVDVNPAALALLREEAASRGLVVKTVAADLEVTGATLDRDAFDVVAVFNYLHRPIFPALIDALRAGGILLYE